MEQIILAILIIALGFYVFHFYPFEKGNIMNLVLATVFLVLTAICKRLAIMIPLFGTESLKIGFEYLPLMLAGYYLSPSYAFLVGLCSDVIGLILVPTGFPFLGFTLGTILVSVIPSLVKEHVQRFQPQHVRFMTIFILVALGLGASIYIWTMNSVTISETAYVLKRTDKVFLVAICIALVILFIGIMTYLGKRIQHDDAKIFSTWMLSVILVELVVTLCMTPLWLDIMYGIPYVVSLCIRVIKECAVLPIEIFIGYTLIQFLNKILTKTRS